MGRTMQKRLTRKLDLEMLLSQIKPHPSPNPRLEQYTIPTDVAATILYLAAYTYRDIEAKTVLDLGCGTGRLALGAAYLGAKQVTGVDIDKTALKTAAENSLKTGLKQKVQWINADIESVQGKFDTVLQNPPFGVQKRGADRKFLEKALQSGKIIYSLHKATEEKNLSQKKHQSIAEDTLRTGSTSFLSRFIETHGGKIKTVQKIAFTIPHMFSFHSHEKHEFAVDLYIIERANCRLFSINNKN
jgi:putative methylase